MNWKEEIPIIQPSTLGDEREQQIDDEVCSLLYHFGPDRHIDGHEKITAYICGLISAERDGERHDECNRKIQNLLRMVETANAEIASLRAAPAGGK